ncbi:MAG: hypothetical protein WAX69_05550 [Victivallales bacterium]
MNKEKKSRDPKLECPGHDDVSAHFDGKLEKGSPESNHIGSCPECQAKLKDFASIAGILDRRSRAKLPDNFPEHMLHKVRTRISTEKNPVMPFYPVQFMKAAAVFLIIAVIFVYVKNSSDEKPLLAKAPIRSSPPAALLAAVPERPSTEKAGRPGEIQLQALRDVSTSPDIRFMNFTSPKESLTEKPVSIPVAVSHVWVAGNIRNAVEKARYCLVQSGIPGESIKFSSDGKGTSTLTIDMNKKQLSSFVKLFAKDGFELLSPVQPQPEQNIFFGEAGDQVGYELKIVSGNR